MPITNVGLPNGVIGPGVQVNLRTSLIGSLPTDYFWEIRVFPHGDETNGPISLTAPLDTIDQHQARLVFGLHTPTGFGTYYSPQIAFKTGDVVDMQYTLWNATQTVAEDTGGDTSFTWDTNDSASTRIPVSSGGLTDAEAAQLAEVHNLVIPPFTDASGVALPTDIGDLVRRPAAKLLGIDTTTHTLTGSGTLDIPSLLGFPIAWGIVMDVTSAPAGWGRKAGYVDSFNYRIAQFLYLLPSANGEGAMVIDEYRLHLEHFTWIFEKSWGTAIAYYIDPPCEVQIRFLTAFGP